jgi:hypothetical protein
MPPALKPSRYSGGVHLTLEQQRDIPRVLEIAKRCELEMLPPSGV